MDILSSLSVSDEYLLQQAGLDPERFMLGTLCRRNHEWQNTGASLRRVNRTGKRAGGPGECVYCKGVREPGKGTSVYTTVEERFWSKVEKTDSILDGVDTPCWDWAGFRNEKGYGHFNTINLDEDFISGLAHRYSYYLHFGSFDTSLLVCHKCDRPSCVNPDHLFLGSNIDNMNDMKSKGRSPRRPGESHHNSKLSEDEVREIHKLCKTTNTPHKEIGQIYGVSGATVGKINTGDSWKHLEYPSSYTA